MAEDNLDILTKCVDLTRHIVDLGMMCYINVKIGEGKDSFEFKFDNNISKKKPSQEKRDLIRKKEFLKNKVKLENDVKKEKEVSDEKKDVKENETLEPKKFEKIKFKIAAHMGSGAESVLKSAVSKNFSYDLSKKVKWDRSESKWDIPEKVDGIFAGVHIFEVHILEKEIIEENLRQLKKNWKKDGQFPTNLMEVWME